MAKLKEFARRVPLLFPLFRMLRAGYLGRRLRGKNTEQVFTDIYTSNAWSGKDSISGTGSDAHQTRVVSKELPIVFSDFGISTVLDVPCGDFHWMKNVDLSGVDYTGADIVEEIIKKNKKKHQRDGVRFQVLNLISDELPKADLVFCRDCLVHLSFEDIFSALSNLCSSESEYLLATTFPQRTENRDIATGDWRVLNLQAAPFGLPKPIKVISEGCTESDGRYADKSLGLWRIEEIRESLSDRTA